MKGIDDKLIHFRFFTNSSSSGRGFKISYQESCGGNFTQDGELVSPYFPKPSGAFECIYIISQSTFAVNEIQIDQFDLGQLHDGCNFSFLEVRDGINETSPLLGRFCGSLSEEITSLKSSQNKVWIK